MKTLLIAHRGNILGPDEKNENEPSYIIHSIKEGFDCEIDLRYDNLSNQFYLGHDSNQYRISKEWLLEYKDNLWIHCKDFDSLNILSLFDESLNYFWHENDKFTLTSKGYIWTYPNNMTSKKSVIVSLGPERPSQECFGICSDYVQKLK